MNQELLDRLEKADPVLWETFDGTEFGKIEDIAVYIDDLIPDVREAWLQACLQAAIRARKWGYGMEYYMTPHMVGASIYVLGDDFDKKTIGAGYCSTEAEALCLAYLAALESP